MAVHIIRKEIQIPAGKGESIRYTLTEADEERFSKSEMKFHDASFRGVH
jgi:hypothetical protein